jgi:hypothetical protein
LLPMWCKPGPPVTCQLSRWGKAWYHTTNHHLDSSLSTGAHHAIVGTATERLEHPPPAFQNLHPRLNLVVAFVGGEAVTESDTM